MKQLIFKSICGSIAQGTSSPSSDRDEKHIYLTDEFEIIKDYTTQTEHWELRKFLSVCAKGLPFELETLYAPQRCWLMPLPFQLQDLIDNKVFITQDTIKMYQYCAELKLRQSGNECNKRSAHAIRYLLEIIHMLTNKSGPKVDVGEDRDLLMGIKYNTISVDKVKETYQSLWTQITQLPMDLPIKADVVAIDQCCQKLYSTTQHPSLL